MHLIYSLILWLLAPFIIIYHLYRSWSRGRPPAFTERFGFIPTGRFTTLAGRRPIWVHAVSVGETIAVRPLLRGLKQRFPDRPLVLSNTTETGRSIGQGIPEVDFSIYFPFDFGFAVRRLLGAIRPSLVVIVETEIWPNFLRAAQRQGVPVLLANGRIADRAFPRYLRMQWFFRPALARYSAFCMQGIEDARRIEVIGAPAGRVHVAGNLKFDIPVTVQSPQRRAALREKFGLDPDVLLFTVASTHEGEEELVLSACRQVPGWGGTFGTIIVPRHPERAPAVGELLRRDGVPFVLRSRLPQSSTPLARNQVLLVDTVGELLELYALSDLVFVGGSLVPTGGHNLLEPAACGVPSLFGPHTSNFREIAALVCDAGAGIRVADGAELAVTVARLLADPAERRRLGENGVRLMSETGGATARHLEIIATLLEGRE